MIVQDKSPETFFKILEALKKMEQNYRAVLEEIRLEFGPNPEDCLDFHASWLSQERDARLFQIIYWKDELYNQLNLN
jgi:hypothetical protein